MEIIWGASNPSLHRHLCDFVEREIGGHGYGFGNCVAMGVLHHESIIAGVVFHNFEPKAGVIEVSAAATSKLWMSRPVLKRLFSYVFIDIECQMCVMRISEFNKPMQRMLRAYGFESVFIPRLRGRDQGEFIFTLTNEAWRSNKFNSKENTRAAA